MRRSEPWRVIAVPMEANSKQRGQPPRMHESGELKCGQKGQRVHPPFHRSKGTATSGAIICVCIHSSLLTNRCIVAIVQSLRMFIFFFNCAHISLVILCSYKLPILKSQLNVSLGLFCSLGSMCLITDLMYYLL